MRRYTPARNPIQRLREQWGLGQSDDAVIAGPPAASVHPLPTTPRAAAAAWMRPLPTLPGRPFYDPLQRSGEGAIDYLARQVESLTDVPKGSPLEPVTVYPNWESRLVNMRDFVAVVQSQEDYAQIVPFTALLSEYVVPQGYTAFWKEFRFFSNPVPVALIESNTLLTLLVDGLPVPNFVRMPLGPLMAAPQKTFVIAAEGRRLSVQLTTIEDTSGSVPSTTVSAGTIFSCLLYGNLRLRTGGSTSTEVGTAAPPPPPPPMPVAPPTPRVVAAPPRIAPPPPPPPRSRPAAPTAPPFAVNWGAGKVNGQSIMKPFDQSTGQKRWLTTSEVRQYLTFLRGNVGGGKPREFFETYLRSIGVQ